MNRLEITASDKAQSALEKIYSDVERRMEASPVGNCPVELTSAFVKLCLAQSCGKCVPCRVGLDKLAALMDGILEGEGSERDLELIKNTALAIYDTSDCAIGFQTAKFVLDNFAAFKDDYISHIKSGCCTANFASVPCVQRCPAHVDIPGYIALVAEQRYADAVCLIRKDNPFPAACALICEHPCEHHCRRTLVDDAVNIRGLKRYAADHCGLVPPPECCEPTGKTVAIIGGGIGGMEAALVCAKRGHKVTLYERSSTLGGVFVAAAAPSFKEKDRELIAWYIRELQKYPITIKLNTEIKSVASLSADEVIVATGATARKINVTGAETAIEAIDYLLGSRKVGENVAVIGGGLTGCEIAYDLYLKGKHPTIIEMQDDLITTKGICLANTSYLRDFFKTNKVPVFLETSLSQIKPGSVELIDKTGNQFALPADSVIMSVGYTPAPIAAKGKHIHVIGDAAKVGNLRTVIWGAWDVCMKL
mgnify:CR=1 FL=1